ncbi:DUF6636 domain-containing protein [Mycolicibacterium sp. 050232]|uniref:DUF6636 domain-containing protein n=1 Tax=Mycolicibacterium sp. 050232 TaxID=3113982 RepID=UPI002E2E3451|nr:DUF6636 domain-containing protein [Mycolicibacterium sp. 050232]MED5815298.1 DUF6636 domain-containing protein [Mycolicibacterium sp. 050232]
MTEPAPAVTPNFRSVSDVVNRQVKEPTAFSSPSGNVGCHLDSSMARCDIRDRSWAPPLRPASCAFAYGQGMTLRPGRPAEFVCAGDTALGPGAELGYGDSITAGTLRCESADTGITCRDTKTRHGFAISRQAYHLF